MEISITHQCQSFLLALGVGAGLSLLYDLFRFLRLILPEQSWRIAVEDVLYCLLCGFITVRFALWADQGRLRIYLLLGELLGWLLCHFTLGQLLYAAARRMIDRLSRILRWLFRHILLPLYKLLRRILSVFLKIMAIPGKIFKKLSIRCKFFLKRRAILLYNLIKSEKFPIFRKR